MNQIWLLLGLKPDGFRSGMKRAIDDTKQFERTWKDLRKIFAAGGITALALGFLRSMANEAQQTRDELEKMGQPIPATVSALAALADTFDSFGRGVQMVVGGVVLGIQGMFDDVATGINRLRGITAEQESQYLAILRSAEQEERDLAAAREANSPEKVAAALAKLDETRRQSLISRAEGEDKLNLLLAEHVRLTQEASAYGERSIKGAELREKIERNLTQIAQVGAQLDKDKARVAEQSAEQLARFAKEHGERLELEAKVLSGRITPEEKIRLEVMQKQEQAAKNLSELQLLMAKGANNLSASERDRVSYLVRQNELIDSQVVAQTQQAKKVELTNDQVKEHIALLQSAAMRQSILTAAMEATLRISDKLYGRSHDLESIQMASDAELAELVRRQSAEIAWVESQKGLGLTAAADAATNFFNHSMVIARLRTDIERAMAELAQRASLRADYAVGGASVALRNFKGDPLSFERLLQQAVSGSTSTNAEALTLLRRISDNTAQAGDPALSAAIQRLTQSTTILAGRLGG